MAISKVYLDTDRVYLGGERPKSDVDLWALVEGFLGQSNHVIDEFIEEGK